MNLPPMARLLYYEMGMQCDDDGFCACPGKILRMTGASRDDLAELLRVGLVLDFDGVAVITDWRIHNSLKSDRIRMVTYPDIAERLWIKRTGRYTTNREEGLMTLLEYHDRYVKEHRDPLREYRAKSWEYAEKTLDPEKKRKEEIRKEEKRTEEIRMEGKGAEAAPGLAPEGPDDPDDPDDPESAEESSPERLEPLGGELGQDVLWLTDTQMTDLLDRMSLEEFQRYTRRLSDYILQKGDHFHSHYRTILRWWEQDKAVDGPPVPMQRA